MVHEPHEVLRRTETGGGGKIPRALIAPGIVQRVLRHRQQLHGIVAHVGDIGRQLPGHVPVIKKVAVFMPAPRAEMHLVNIERRTVDGRGGAARAPRSVPPAIVRQIVELTGRARTGLCVEGVGVCLEHRFPLRGAHGVLIGVEPLQAGDKALPQAERIACHRIRARVPAAEIAHNGNTRSIRRPDAEDIAVLPLPARAVRAEIAVGLAARAAEKGRRVKSCVRLLHAHLLCFSLP